LFKLDVADSSKETQVRTIEEQFEDAKPANVEKLTHPTKKGVHVVESIPIFPDFDHWQFQFYQGVFDSNPMPPKSDKQPAGFEVRALLKRVMPWCWLLCLPVRRRWVHHQASRRRSATQHKPSIGAMCARATALQAQYLAQSVLHADEDEEGMEPGFFWPTEATMLKRKRRREGEEREIEVSHCRGDAFCCLFLEKWGRGRGEGEVTRRSL